ncbi:hypothetical protein ACQZ6K_15095 [Rhizobium sp. A41-96]
MMTVPCIVLDLIASIPPGKAVQPPYVDALRVDFGKECGLIKATFPSDFPHAACSTEINYHDLHEA